MSSQPGKQPPTRCPNGCLGDLLLTRMHTHKVEADGSVPEITAGHWDDEYVLCNECGEIPTHTWSPEGRIQLLVDIDGSGPSTPRLEV